MCDPAGAVSVTELGLVKEERAWVSSAAAFFTYACLGYCWRCGEFLQNWIWFMRPMIYLQYLHFRYFFMIQMVYVLIIFKQLISFVD